MLCEKYIFNVLLAQLQLSVKIEFRKDSPGCSSMANGRNVRLPVYGTEPGWLQVACLAQVASLHVLCRPGQLPFSIPAA